MTTTHDAPTGTAPAAVRSDAGRLADSPSAVTAAALVAAVETERTSVAGTLHDGVVQGLVAARLALDIAERRGADVTALAPIRSALAGALREARQTLWSLRSRGRDGDVLAALSTLAEHLADQDGPRLELHDGGLPDDVSATASMVAYRVVQAAASQVHGGSVSVDLAGTPAGALRLVICAPGVDDAPRAALLGALDHVILCGGSVLPVPAGLIVTIPAGEEPA